VDAQWRHQGGEAVDQLHGGEKQRAAIARTRLGDLIAQSFEPAFVQADQGERWPCAASEQPLAPGRVGGRDMYRGVDGEAAAVLPLHHRLSNRHRPAAGRGAPEPNQIAYIERFNRTYRTEVLDAYLFCSSEQVQHITEEWLREYNEQCPHDALGGLPPRQFMPKLTTAADPSSGMSA
jgi:hypothetical protein